jgi:hypothetical protein
MAGKPTKAQIRATLDDELVPVTLNTRVFGVAPDMSRAVRLVRTDAGCTAVPLRIERTPAGIPLLFDEPSHCYLRLVTADDAGEVVDPQRWQVADLDSVTGVLGILDKPALKSWAEKGGVAGAVELARTGQLPQDVDQALAALERRQLRWWQERRKAAERGQVSHEELVRVCTGELVDLDQFAPEFRGFFQGVSAWYADHNPEVLAVETMVVSAEHGVAGRPDLRCVLRAAPDHPHLAGALVLADLKTVESIYDRDGKVKDPYDENVLQLGGYEGLSIESGYGPTDRQVVVRVDKDGNYAMAESWARPADFFAVLGTYRTIRALRARKAAVRSPQCALETAA